MKTEKRVAEVGDFLLVTSDHLEKEKDSNV